MRDIEIKSNITETQYHLNKTHKINIHFIPTMHKILNKI